MDWNAIGAIGELIGALAVVLSLLYVGKQIRIASSRVQVEGMESLSDKMADLGLMITNNPELAKLVYKVQVKDSSGEDFDYGEHTQLGYLYYTVFIVQAGLYERYRAGLIDRDTLERLSQRTDGLTSARYRHVSWAHIRGGLDPDLAEWLERKYQMGPHAVQG